jgi:hypothetical protein
LVVFISLGGGGGGGGPPPTAMKRRFLVVFDPLAKSFDRRVWNANEF